MTREVLQQALAVLKGCLEHPDAQDSIIAIEHELAQPEQLQWTDAAGVQYTFPLQGATQLLADLYAEWPGGLAEIEAAMRTRTAQPEQAQETWTTPTTFLRRFGDAMQALCKGHRPTDESMSEWVDPASGSIELQHFACQYGFAWAQGIGLIDAALVAADQPTEGPAHEYRVELVMPEQEPVATTAADHIKNEMGYCQFHANVPNDTKLYTSPPKRQPLTHEKRVDLLTAFAPSRSSWNAESILIDMVEAAHDIGDKT